MNGSEVVFHEGILATAMRSSMSIPGVFAPVDLDGMVLVDGGMVNNYPVDVALAMGADYIIGVDVQSPLLKASELKSVKDIFGQIINLQGEKKYRENLRNTDVLIKVDVTGYSAASFTKEAIDTLMVRGERAAMDSWDGLLALKRKLGLAEDYQPRRPGPFRLPGAAVDREIPVDSQIAAPAVRENKLNVGFRFDTEELAALQANTDFYFGRQRESLASLTARLGKRTLARLGYSYQWDGGWQAGLAYQFDYKDMNIYNEGKRALDLTFTHQLVRMGAAKDWNNIQVSLGIDFDYYHYHDLLSLDPLASALFENSSLFSYFAGLVFNNLNERSAPTKGMSWAVSYHLYTDNLFQYKDNNPISVFDVRWQGCFSPSSKLTVTPSFYGRVLSGSDNYPLPSSIWWGDHTGALYATADTVYGHQPCGTVTSRIAGCRAEPQTAYLENQYISVMGSYGRNSGKFHQILDSSESVDMAGVGIGYMYKSFLGPVEIQLNWSNQTKKVGWYAGFGFVF